VAASHSAVSAALV
jgi:hypothetical protein